MILRVGRVGLAIGGRGRNIHRITEQLRETYGLDNPQIEVTEVEYIIFKCDNYFIENNQCHIVLDINHNTIHYIEYDGAILIKSGKLEQLESNKYKATVIRCCSYCTNLVECHLHMDNIGSHCDELYIDTDTGSIEDRTRLYRTDRLTIPHFLC